MKNLINPAYKYSELTSMIIGCAMKVHKVLGNGFPEIIYQRCLALEFSKANLAFSKELAMPIFYDGIEVGVRKVDFLVDNKVVVELKALMQIEDAHLAQTLNYLEVHRLEIGLLINFGSKALQIKRVTNERKLAAMNNYPQM